MNTDNGDVHDLIRAAEEGLERAYAPHSEFRMGAAVRAVTGEIVAGSLVENVSLGLAMCAERVALFSCVTLGHEPRQLVLVAPRTSGSLTHSCGACLQGLGWSSAAPTWRSSRWPPTTARCHDTDFATCCHWGHTIPEAPQMRAWCPHVAPPPPWA